MRDDFPRPIPGSQLKAARKALGIQQKALADELGMHRITLHKLEESAAVDPIRATRYQNALAGIVAEAVSPESAA